MAIRPSDYLTEHDSGAAFVRKANALLAQSGADLGATEAARDAAGGHAAQADSAAASAASAAAMAAQIRSGQRQGGPLTMPTLMLDWGNNSALDPRIRYSRAGDAWEANQAGILTRYAANQWGWNGGRSVWPALTNKLTCRKNNPVSIDGVSITGSDPNITGSVVTNEALLRSAGLGAVCTNGAFYRLDARSATITNFVNLAGSTGNTNPHNFSLYLWGSGTVALRANQQGAPSLPVTLTATPTRYSWPMTPPAASGNVAQLVVSPGAEVFFILPQLIEAPYAGPVIPGDTLAATTRAADTNLLPMASWFNPAEGTFAVRASAAPGNGRLFHLSRGIGSGGVRAQMQTNSTGARQIAMVDEGGVVTVAGMFAGASGVGGTSIFAYGADGIAAIGPGQSTLAKTSATLPTGLGMSAIGCDTGGVSQLASALQHFSYLPRRVSDAEMIYLRDTL